MKGSRLRAALTPYVLILPGGLWLAIFFVVPMIVMLSLSLHSGNITDGFRVHLELAELPRRASRTTTTR